jgi:hypothetical protein
MLSVGCKSVEGGETNHAIRKGIEEGEFNPFL